MLAFNNAPAPLKNYAKRLTYRMVKTQAVAEAPSTASWEHEDYLDPLDATHTQLFYRTNTTTDTPSTLRPSYYREVRRPSDNHDFYWYSAALKTPQQPSSSPSASANKLWTIEPMRIEYTRFLRRARLPREFTIEYTPTSTRCTFHRCTDSDGRDDYEGEVVTPFDATCVQRYRWHRKGNNGAAHWQLVAQNARDSPLVEFRPSGIPNEYEIEFLQPAPSGWSPRVADRLSRYSGLTGGRASGFISTPDNGSDSRASVVLNPQSGMRWRVSDDDRDREEDSRYWEEFVLATTVVVQDEVNVRPSSHLCMSFLPFC